MTSAPPPADFYLAEAYQADESIGYLMKQVLSSIVQSIDAQLGPHDLTHVQWGPLLMIRQGRATTVAELARELQTDPGAMTRLLDRLETKGLCQRVRSTEDRRVVNLALTPAGEKAVAVVPAALAQVLNAHLSGFTLDEWQALKGFLRRLLANGEALRQSP